MTRYERSTFFNRLLELQAAYAHRDASDRTPGMTVAEAIAFAEHVLATAAPAEEQAPAAATETD